MYKAVLMLVLSVVSSHAAAVWVEVGSDETATVYADPATIRKTGERVKMWSLFDYKTARVPGKPLEPYLSMRGYSEYDCKKTRSRALSVSFHPRGMASGDVTYTNAKRDKWRPLTPGSVAENLWKTACGK